MNNNETTVLNLDNKGWVTGEYPLFLGEELGLHDTINRPYPQLFDLFKKLKSLDWAEDEINLAQARMDFESCDQSSYDVMIKTLSWQWEADSVASRSIIALFAPFISNGDLNQMMLRWSDGEALHATTYSEIVRQCINNPDDIFAEITSNKHVTERSGKIVEAFNRLKVLGAAYTLNKNLVCVKEIREVLLKAVVSLYCLEAMEFMASFACTFALAERELFLPVASLVQKIMIDETIHTKMDEAIIDILMEEEEWRETYLRIKPDIQEIVDSVYQQEMDWSEYIFSEGRAVVGLNTPLLQERVQFLSQVVYDKLDLTIPFERVETNSLPWMDKWLDIDSQQTAAQETDLNNYRLNSVIKDNKDFSGFDFGDRNKEREDKKFYSFTVYSKNNCTYCAKLKMFMNMEGIEYKEVSVDADTKGRDFLLKEGHKTLPQVYTKLGDHVGDCMNFISNYESLK